MEMMEEEGKIRLRVSAMMRREIVQRKMSADEDALNTEVDEIMQNIFGNDYKNEDSFEELY